MTSYTATIQHHSISRARNININGTLTQAKRAASREFGAEQLDYNIVIFENRPSGSKIEVSARKVGSKKWVDIS